jgi:tetratricopeptide (TPR) repeat protein
MKIPVSLFLIAVTAFVNAGQGELEPGTRERTFVRALELFDHAKTAGEYREAAQLFESLLTDDYQNGAVFYNAGNAYFRAGDFGRAIANYRKAKIFRPRDARLDANLRQALAVAPGRLAQPPEPFWKHILFWSEWLSFPEKFQAIFGVFCLGLAFGVSAVLLRRKRLFWFAGFGLAITLVLSVDAFLTDANMHSRHAVVTAETMPRLGSGDRYEAAFNQPLKDGAEFTIIDRNGDWVLGHFEGIGDGWVRRDSIAE